MDTKRETLRLMCKSMITRLENQKSISFPPRLRQIIQDEIFGLIGPLVLTEEDIRDRTLVKMGAKAELLKETEIAESDQFRSARAIVKSECGDHQLNGFYFQRSLKDVAHVIAEYFMRSSHIDDVYEMDDELELHIVNLFKQFNPAQVH